MDPALSGGVLSLKAAGGGEFLVRLVKELTVPISSINLRRPTLNDVFLALTGRQIRDEDAPKTPPRTCACDAGSDKGGDAMEAIFALWYRDILRFVRNRGRLFGSFAMPFMFLVLFGSGMGGAIKSLMGGARLGGPLSQFNFVEFMFPGIIGMTVFTTSLFSALSVVQDREFGYLKEISCGLCARVDSGR